MGRKVKVSESGSSTSVSCPEVALVEEAVAAGEANGGRTLQAPQDTPPYGRRAVMLDSEGNRIALHSP
mgnify:CR=1 FL=1